MLVLFTNYEINEKELKKLSVKIKRLEKKMMFNNYRNLKLVKKYNKLIEKYVDLF